ncbi:hypothetical protein FNF27_07636 [Cafeteria roenbergensis]|uniref:Mitochondrial carrier protein n=2 Tax=Cafeteria roenbergensis TaxID=33653 RepID=A0A5A8DKA2_CAFRO|nr:hypothetical protein FNF27_07636 [Cafeteria roenbergensis]
MPMRVAVGSAQTVAPSVWSSLADAARTGAAHVAVADAAVSDLRRMARRSAAPRIARMSTTDTFLHVARTEGAAALWSGVLPTLVMAVPSTMMYFTAYDELKETIEGRTAPGSAVHQLAPLIAGGVARAGAATVVSPLELVRTKLQAPAAAKLLDAASSGASRAASPLQLARALGRAAGQAGSSMRLAIAEEVRLGGVASLWRGVVPTLWRDVPFSMVYWLGYERLREASTALIARETGSSMDHPPIAQRFAVAFAAGAGSGSVAAVLTTPFDVVKTRVQVRLFRQQQEARRRGPGCAGLRTPSTLEALLTVAREEGAASLFTGLGARVAKVAPACAIMISSYEACKLFLARR